MTESVWDRLLLRARLAPSSIAVIGPRGPVTYHRLVEQTAGLATELLQRGVTAGDIVGLHLGPTYLHLLLILALDRLGVPSSAIATQQTGAQLAPVVAGCGFTTVVSAAASPADAACRWIRMTEQDAPEIGAPDIARLRAIEKSPDTLVRVLWSSGTTGGAKGARLLRRCQMLRFGLYQLLFGYGPATRYLLTMGFATSNGYGKALGVLTGGGTLVLPMAGLDLGTVARLTGATAMGTNVAMLGELIERHGASLRGLEHLQLEVTGSHVPTDLARQSRLLFTPNAVTIYGATESTTVAIADMVVGMAQPGAVGYLVPSIAAEIVDAEDRPLQAGQEGRLRLRGAQLVDGYFRNEAATRAHFRDGWFYPGDVGSIGPDRLLRITGRVSDLVTAGGLELAPVPIEAAISAQPGVREAAVFPLKLADGRAEICVALVLQAGIDPAAVLREAQAKLGARAPSRAIVVPALPRGSSGKVLKRELLRLAEQAMASGSASA